MKNLIEKLKSVDKKVFIGVGVALVVVVVAIVAVVIGTGNEPANADPNNTNSNNEYVANENNDVDDNTSDSTNADDESSTDESDSSTEEDSSTSEEDSTKDNENSDKGEGTTATQQPTATNPSGEEIIGAGSESQPYLEFPDDKMTLTTVKVPAGKSLHYGIYRVGGMYLTINDADAYVICDGTKYTAKNGKVSFKVPSALASDAVYFEIGNNGSTAKSFKLSFTNPKGTFANPKDLDKIDKDIEISLAAGNEVGYYYEYKAEKTGTIRFYMTATKDSILSVTNNSTSAQRTTEADVLTDENGNEYIEIEVKKGDELIINVGAMPTKRGKYPATDITWHGEYV